MLVITLADFKRKLENLKCTILEKFFLFAGLRFLFRKVTLFMSRHLGIKNMSNHVLHFIIVFYFIYNSGVLGYCNEESCFMLCSKAGEAVFEYGVTIYIYRHIFCVRHFL